MAHSKQTTRSERSERRSKSRDSYFKNQYANQPERPSRSSYFNKKTGSIAGTTARKNALNLKEKLQFGSKKRGNPMLKDSTLRRRITDGNKQKKINKKNRNLVRQQEKYEQKAEEEQKINVDKNIKMIENRKSDGIKWTYLKSNISEISEIKFDEIIQTAKYDTCGCDKNIGCDPTLTINQCYNASQSIECNDDICSGNGKLCGNRRISKGIKTKVYIKNNNGYFSLVADQNITSGSFVIEYVGEILDKERKNVKEKVNNNYMMEIDAKYVIDGYLKCNEGAMINHSCAPNCAIKKWELNKQKRMIVVALTDITKGDEITFDYTY